MRIPKKTSLGVVLAVGLVVPLAACGGSSSGSKGSSSNSSSSSGGSTASFTLNKGPSGGTQGGTLKVLGESDNPSYDPSGAYDTNSYQLLRTYARQLYSNPSGNDEATRLKIVPDMADGMPTIGAGGTTYTVKIQSGISWQNGRAVTAQDYVRGIKMVCNPVTDTGPLVYLTTTVAGMSTFCDNFGKVDPSNITAIKTFEEGTPIPGVTAVDASTVKFTLTKPASDFLHFLTLPFASARPVEEMAYLPDGPDFRTHILSDGPYEITSYVADKSVTLARNTHWTASTDTVRKAYVDAIDVVYGGTGDGIQQQLQAGTADIAMGDEPVPTSSLPGLLNASNAQLHVNPTGGENPYLAFNLVSGNSVIKNVKVRQAIEYAVNKAAITQVLGGTKIVQPHGSIFTSSVIGDGYQAIDPYSTSGSAGDPAKAKDLLKQAGYPNGITVKFVYRTEANGPKIATTVQAALQQAGIKVVLNGLSNKDYYTNYLQKPSIAKAGKWDISEPGWSPDWEGSSERSYYSPLLDGRQYPSSTTNYGGYNDDQLNTLADAALSDTSVSDATSKWLQADKVMMADPPWVPLIQNNQANFVSSRVKNYQYYFSASNGDFTNIAVQ